MVRNSKFKSMKVIKKDILLCIYNECREEIKQSNDIFVAICIISFIPCNYFKVKEILNSTHTYMLLFDIQKFGISKRNIKRSLS